MSDPAPDPPRSLAEAEARFGKFLAQNGYPPKIQWLLVDDFALGKEGSYWIRKPQTNAKATHEALRRYALGLERMHGIDLRAICATDSETFANIYVPINDLDAQYHMMGDCLKLTCPTSLQLATIVTNPVVWFFIKWRNRNRGKELEL